MHADDGQDSGGEGGDARRGFPAQRCTVPKLLGLTLQQADVALLHAGCAKGAVTKRRSTRVRPGRVLAQSSAPGAKRPLGTRVGLVVSGGRRR